MKTKFLLRKGILCGILSLLLWGCFKEPDGYTEPDLSRPQNLTLERARATHEAARNRATRSEGDFGILYSGNLEAWWDGAQYSECDFSESYDVEVIAERYYEQVHYLPDSTAVRSTVFPRLVVVEERLRERNPTPYVAFYFPDRLTEENYEQDAGEGLLNSLPKEGFSGVIIYTTLKGFPVAASRHEDGRQLSHAFLGDATDYTSLLEEVEKYNRIVENIRIFVGDETRSSALEDLDGGDVPPVIVTAPPIVRLPKLENPVTDPDPIDWEVTDPSKPNIPDDPIGDDTENSVNNGKYNKNIKIQVEDETLGEILDKIFEDCMGQTLINAIDIDIKIHTNAESDYSKFSSQGVNEIYLAGDANNIRPFVLIEELIHNYQYQQAGHTQFASCMMNYEIEAKVCWLMYECRSNGYTDLGDKYDRQLGEGGGTEAFRLVMKFCYPEINCSDPIDRKRNHDFYSIARDFLRTIPPYGNSSVYKESEACRNFDNMKELMVNCYQ